MKFLVELKLEFMQLENFNSWTIFLSYTNGKNRRLKPSQAGLISGTPKIK